MVGFESNHRGARHYEIKFHQATYEEIAAEERIATAGKYWRGNTPYLRLIHALVDIDDNKTAF